MWVHKPDDILPRWVWASRINSLVPAVDAFDLAKGGRTWIVMSNGKEILVRETLGKLSGEKE